MSGLSVLVLASAVILAVAAIGVSLFAVWRAQVLVVLADQRAAVRLDQGEARAQALKNVVDGLSVQLREFQTQSPGPGVAGLARPGLNLTKRSQVLRMHRQGEASDQISAALQLPLQEVDLLIKVHRIVIQSL